MCIFIGGWKVNTGKSLHFSNTVIAPVTQTQKIKALHLFCDNCSGQNKNYTVWLMLWMFCNKSGVNLEWIFPVKGHSYMPADRAFAKVEKQLHRVGTLILPSEYDISLEKTSAALQTEA